MKERKHRAGRYVITAALLAVMMALCAAALLWLGGRKTAVTPSDAIPVYDAAPYTVLDGNLPSFTAEELAADAYETYGQLDELGRCTPAMAMVGVELMPTEGRESIQEVHPTGWKQNFYDFMGGEALYNRCHLIAFQLTGENANERNLITGTRYMNVQGMEPFESQVGDYVRQTGNHVLYRVTPVFRGTELLARGVRMEAYSVEDDGAGICFHVFCHNVQPGVRLDYATGENEAA